MAPTTTPPSRSPHDDDEAIASLARLARSALPPGAPSTAVREGAVAAWQARGGSVSPLRARRPLVLAAAAAALVVAALIATRAVRSRSGPTGADLAYNA